MKAMRSTNSHACGLQPLIHPILAIIAFNHFSGFGIPLRGSPGTGGNAGFASHTQGRIHKNDTIFRTFLHGSSRTSRDTPGIFAVKTRHEHIRCPGKSSDKFRSNFNDLTNLGTGRKRFVAFAYNFTGMATNTLFGILKKKVFTHYDPPNETKTALLFSGISYAALTLTNVS
jgi:hypothetical protein